MVLVWVVGKLCDRLVTHGPYLSAFEVQPIHNKALDKSTLLVFTRKIRLRAILDMMSCGDAVIGRSVRRFVLCRSRPFLKELVNFSQYFW